MTEREDSDADTLRPDGGNRKPGVPDQSGSADRGRDHGDDTSRRMPGVPEPRGGDSEAEAAASGSCESAAAAETSDEPVHDLTTAFTFEALTRLENPRAVLAEARSWSDWVGMVGEADVPTMNTFLRRRDIAVDFFNGGSGPVERLEDIAVGTSPFQEERLVLVGLADQSWIAADAGWEFEPLEEAARTAGWDLEDEDTRA